MGTQKEDRGFIITDQRTKIIGYAIEQESKQVGADTKLILLEDYGPPMCLLMLFRSIAQLLLTKNYS